MIWASLLLRVLAAGWTSFLFWPRRFGCAGLVVLVWLCRFGCACLLVTEKFPLFLKTEKFSLLFFEN